MTSRMTLTLLALVLLALPAHARRAVADAEVFASEADAFIAAALDLLPEVPGLAVAVVVDDQVVLSRGYGMADLEDGVPASGDVDYYIASATKPFTALAAAILHERGDIDLDSSLASHLAGSGMDMALVDDSVTLRDLLSHTAGLRNSPVTTRLAYTGEHTPDLLWSLLSATEANEAGPGAFEYTNFGYNLLTMILDRELGKRWQDVLQDEVFGPAGLVRTTAYASRPATMGWPLAAPYFGMSPDGMQRISLVKVDATMQSAGGMMTTADDAARWMLLQINGGELDGQPVFDATVVRETQSSRIDPGQEERGLFGNTGCGLGWLHGAYSGEHVLHHSGGYPGFRSLISFMPEARIGVTVLVNEGSVGGMVPDALAAWVYDWWLGLDSADHADGIARIAARRDQFKGRIAEDRQRRAEREWALELDRSAYAGRYASNEYGVLEVSLDGVDLHARLGQLHAVAEPFTRPNSIRVEMVPGQGEVLQFVLDDANGIVGIDYDGTRFTRE